jgi:hypothetical protein
MRFPQGSRRGASLGPPSTNTVSMGRSADSGSDTCSSAPRFRATRSSAPIPISKIALVPAQMPESLGFFRGHRRGPADRAAALSVGFHDHSALIGVRPGNALDMAIAQRSIAVAEERQFLAVDGVLALGREGADERAAPVALGADRRDQRVPGAREIAGNRPDRPPAGPKSGR